VGTDASAESVILSIQGIRRIAMSPADIVQKLWNYCNVLRDDLSACEHAQAGGMSICLHFVRRQVATTSRPLLGNCSRRCSTSCIHAVVRIPAPGRYRLLPLAALLRPCTARHSNIPVQHS
jgi:hypothetical protein